MTETTKELAKTETRCRTYSPDVDIVERAEGIELLADMPGVSEDSLEITIEEHVLTIEGKVEGAVPEGYTSSHTEYTAGDYRHAFKVSDELDTDAITGSINDGVLKLRLPKTKKAEPKRITIN